MDQASTETTSQTTAQGDTTATGGQTTAASAVNLGAPEAQAATETGDKPAADAKAEDSKDAAEGDKPAGAPEQYEPFAMPEGYTLDEQLLSEFTPVLKELNLPQDAAQKVIDFAPKVIEKTVQQTTSAVLQEVGLADRHTWAEAVQSDKEIGGEKLAENLALAQKAVNAFGTPELRAMFLKTGVGAHPELVKAFVRIGKQISEDSFVPGGKTASPQDAAARMYSASKMNP